MPDLSMQSPTPRSPQASPFPTPTPGDSNSVESLAKQAIATLIAGDFQAQWDAAKQLDRLGIGALDAVLAALQDTEDPEIAGFLASVLGQIAEPQALTALVSLMETATAAAVRERAAIALVDLAIQAPELRSPVIEALQAVIANGSAGAAIAQRCMAVQALARLPHRDALAPLLQALAVEEPTVQAAALGAIAQFPDPQVAAAIAHHLHDLDPQSSPELASHPLGSPAWPRIEAAIQAAGDYGSNWYSANPTDANRPDTHPTQAPPYDTHRTLTPEGHIALHFLQVGLQRAVQQMLVAEDPSWVDPRLGAIAHALRRWPGREAGTLLGTVIHQAIAADATARATPVATILAMVLPVLALRLERETLPQVSALLPLLTPAAAVETIQTMAATCRLLPVADQQRQAVHQILASGLQAQTPTLRSLRVRTALAIALGDLRVAESFDPLVAWLGWDDPRLRFHALATLRQLDPDQGRARAIALVTSWADAQRAIALETLAEWPT